MKISRLTAVALLALTLASGVTSFADSADRITLPIPFAFTVGERTLPAGIYRLQPMSSTYVALVRVDAGRRHSTMVSTMAVAADLMPRHAKLVFHRYGEHYFLTQVWMPERNLGHELPTSRAERALRRQLKQREKGLARTTAEPQLITLVARR